MRNMETKSRVRKEILKLRNELDEKEALNRSISICNRIIENSYYQEMDDIFVNRQLTFLFFLHFILNNLIFYNFYASL